MSLFFLYAPYTAVSTGGYLVLSNMDPMFLVSGHINPWYVRLSPLKQDLIKKNEKDTFAHYLLYATLVRFVAYVGAMLLTDPVYPGLSFKQRHR